MPTSTRRAKPEPAFPAFDGPCFLGIDPGLKGGIAVVADRQEWACPAPTTRDAGGKVQFDRERMVATLRAFPITFAAIELVDAAPMRGQRQGTTSMFRFGSGFGLWLGILEAIGIPYVEVGPKVWKKAVLKGMGRDKTAAIEYVRRFRTGVSLRPPRSRVDHDGIADATCLAEYAKREWAMREAMRKN